VIRDILYQMVYNKPRINPQTQLIKRVVDIGCGTGLSTYFWAGHAEEVIGVEPSGDMLAKAKSHLDKFSGVTKFSFVQNISSATGLPNDSVDVITCSQSLHWMDPETTFKEAVRILRPGGVFMAFDCDWPPTVLNYRAEKAYQEFKRRVKNEGKQRGLFKDIKKFKKGLHLQRMKDSGVFTYVKEIVINHQEQGNCDRLVAIVLSRGAIDTTRKSS